MPHITTCTCCGAGYEEASEEAANNPTERLCRTCWETMQRVAAAPRTWTEQTEGNHAH